MTTEMPRSSHQSRNSRIFAAPARCPCAAVSSARCRAQRRLPSMIIATCCGSVLGGEPAPEPVLVEPVEEAAPEWHFPLLHTTTLAQQCAPPAHSEARSQPARLMRLRDHRRDAAGAQTRSSRRQRCCRTMRRSDLPHIPLLEDALDHGPPSERRSPPGAAGSTRAPSRWRSRWASCSSRSPTARPRR